MIRFDLSEELVKPLKTHMQPPTGMQADFAWRTWGVEIGSSQCIVAEEQNTQYMMIFCGVDALSLVRFPQNFADRFWREIDAIFKKAGINEASAVINRIKLACDEQEYCLDPHPLSEGRPTQVISALERLHLNDRHPLPPDPRSAFEYSYTLNSRLLLLERMRGQKTPIQRLVDRCFAIADTPQYAGQTFAVHAGLLSETNTGFGHRLSKLS